MFQAKENIIQDFIDGKESAFKEIYEKYASKFYIICKENTDKVIGKKEYDKNPIRYNLIFDS